MNCNIFCAMSSRIIFIAFILFHLLNTITPSSFAATEIDLKTILIDTLELNKTEMEQFYEEHSVSRVLEEGELPLLCPDHSFRLSIQNDFSQVQGNLAVETLNFIPYDKKISLLTLFNILLSVSTMEGTEYYSVSRDTRRTLFTESVVIKDKDNQILLPDPYVLELPHTYTLYLKQTDLTFGTNISKVLYESNEHAIWVHLINLTNMRYLFMNMVKPENLSIHLIVRPVKEGILFYGATTVNTFSFFGLERRRIDSFHNRIIAMHNWFSNRLPE